MTMLRNVLMPAAAAAVIGLAGVGMAIAQERGYGDSYRPRVAEDAPWNGGGEVRDGYPVPQGPAPGAAPQYRPSYKDDPAPPPQAPPPRPYRQSRCLDKFGIQRALHEQGWHEFDNVAIEGPVAYMTARSDRGEPFDLKIESCSGSVIEAHPMVVYRDAPRYYYPRPAVGLYFGYGGGWRHWR